MDKTILKFEKLSFELFDRLHPLSFVKIAHKEPTVSCRKFQHCIIVTPLL